MYIIITLFVTCYIKIIIIPILQKNIWKRYGKQEAHGPHHSPEKQVQIKKHICYKLLLYHNVNLEKTKPIISFLLLNGPYM